tara:strand:- start:72 stop:233 length:162 start_codon:yes stop_codon:yes gene_type:complete
MRDNENDATISFCLEHCKGDIFFNRYYSTGEKWSITKNSILISSIGHSESSKE